MLVHCFKKTPQIRAKSKEKAVNKNRPVNLDFKTIKLPLPALVSIMHRASGVVIFCGIPVLLWVLSCSLESEASFNALKDVLDGFFVTMIIWGIAGALTYHIVAGLKHLLMDVGIGETLEGGLRGARITLLASLVLIIFVGVWLW